MEQALTDVVDRGTKVFVMGILMDDMEDLHVPKVACLNCGHVLDAASRYDDARPRPDDVSICAYCSHVSVWDDEMRLRAPTERELYEIAGDADLVAAMKFVARMRAKRTEEPSE